MGSASADAPLPADRSSVAVLGDLPGVTRVELGIYGADTGDFVGAHEVVIISLDGDFTDFLVSGCPVAASVAFFDEGEGLGAPAVADIAAAAAWPEWGSRHPGLR